MVDFGRRDLGLEHSYGGRPAQYILGDNGVRSNSCVWPNSHRSQDFGAGADVDMSADFGYPRSIPTSDCNLLKNQAIYANLGVRMDHNSVRVGN